MPTLETAAIYPGLCLVEATTLSEGRGTTRPFHLIGAPWVDAEETVTALRNSTSRASPSAPPGSDPSSASTQGRICSGVELHVTDRGALEPVALGLQLLRVFHDLHPDHFAWRAEPYEFVSEVPALDLLTGSPEARECIESGAPFDDLFEAWRDLGRAPSTTPSTASCCITAGTRD